MRRLDEPGEHCMSRLEQSSRPYVVYLMQPQPSAGHQEQHLVLKASVPHEYNNLSETRGKSQLCRPCARTEKAMTLCYSQQQDSRLPAADVTP